MGGLPEAGIVRKHPLFLVGCSLTYASSVQIEYTESVSHGGGGDSA